MVLSANSKKITCPARQLTKKPSPFAVSHPKPRVLLAANATVVIVIVPTMKLRGSASQHAKAVMIPTLLPLTAAAPILQSSLLVM